MVRAFTDETGEHWWNAEIHRLKGRLAVEAGADTDAEACFQQSLEVARRQQARSLELRTATSLAMLWRDQNKTPAARDLLAPLYAWFTEGFDTPDLQDAKMLLDELT